MRTYLIIGGLALALGACGSSSKNPDARVDGGGKKDLRADALGQLDTGTADHGKTDGGKRDGTVTSSCPATPTAATTLTAGTPGPDINGTIADPTKSACYYKIDGKKGDHIWLLTTAKTGTDPFDETYLDTVLTLFDSTQKQLAQNDDPESGLTNDAELYTVLPADGTYYVRVAECNLVAGAANCSAASKITHKDFTLNAMTVTDYQWAVGESAEPNDTQAGAAALPYIKSQSGNSYLAALGYGVYDSPTDVDTFTINLPSDTPVDAGARAVGQVLPLLAGTDGDGSTGPIGKIWIVDPADASHHLAEIDATQGKFPEISPPLKLNTPYYLFVSRASGTAGSNEFYYFQHYGYTSNPLETAEGAGSSFTPKNDTPATAMALTVASNGTSYYIEGDISAAADLDYFSAAVPTTGLTDKTVSVTCGAQRSGSGLRGFKVSVFKSDGTTLLASGATVTESATTDAKLADLALGTETSKVVVKMEATQAQDANVTSTFYRCGVHFN